MFKAKTATLTAVVATFVAGLSYAGTMTPNTGAPQIAPPVTANSPASQAFQAADDRMRRSMGVLATGNADRDFVANMLPHHRGAVDMANIELRYGKDPELRRLAAAIVKAQDEELAAMTAWQNSHP